MCLQVGKLLHDPQTFRCLDLSDRFIAGLLIIAPWASFPRDREGTNAVNDAVVSIDIAVSIVSASQTARCAVGNNICTGAFLVDDGNIDGIAKHFFEILRPPLALLM